jgi:hypothetical protein
MEDVAPVGVTHATILSEFIGLFLMSVSKLPQPADLLPGAAISESSLPIGFAPLMLENGHPSALRMPTVVVGINVGRVAFFSHIDMIIRCNGSDSDFTNFIESVVTFCAARIRQNYRVLVLGAERPAAVQIQANLRKCDMLPDIHSLDPNPHRYHVVIATTDFDPFSALEPFVAAGRGVIVCGVGRASPISNDCLRFLEAHGIGIPKCALSLGDPTVDRTRLPSRPGKFERNRLPAVMEKFLRHIETPEAFKVTSIDKIAAKLRYHISGLTRRTYAVLEALVFGCWRYLDATGGSLVEGRATVCPLAGEAIISSLLVDAMAKVCGRTHQGNDRSLPFPGASDLELGDYEVDVAICAASWFSTGLYLPAGHVCELTIERPVDGCAVQVGAHTISLIGTPLPWKRWALPVVSFPLDAPVLEIASPFGGIVYFVATCGVQPFHAAFRSVGRYPFFSVFEPNSWNETEALVAPWSEVETRLIVLTVPTAFLLTVPDIAKSCADIDDILTDLLTFTCDTGGALYRVVFDPSTRMSEGDPIVMSADALEHVFGLSACSEWFVRLLFALALKSLPQIGFPDPLRQTMAGLAAFAAADARWPGRTTILMDTLKVQNPLFDALKTIYQFNDKALFPTAFEMVRGRADQRLEPEDGLWLLLVNALCHLSGDNCSKQLMELGFNLCTQNLKGSSPNLAAYQLSPEQTSPVP